MAISIDWGTKVISIPKADMTLVQSYPPVEIRELDIDAFRLALKDLEDGEEGMAFPNTHNHNTEVSVGGITLARVVEIINGYTITFEDGQYAVNLIGANSNIIDVLNPNQVSVRSSNSAGLISASFDPSSIADAVWDEDGSTHTTPGSMAQVLQDYGALLLRILGLTQENFYIDQTVYTTYEGTDLLTSGRIRIYDDPANVGSGVGIIMTYAITATYLNGNMQTYKVVSQ